LNIYSTLDSTDDRVVIATNDVLTEMKNIPDEAINLVVTSPPYNIGKEYEQQVDLDAYLLWMESVLAETHRVLKEDGSLVLQVGNFVDRGEIFPLDYYFYPILKKLGFKLRNRIVWHFEHGLHCQKRLSGRYEVLLWVSKSDTYTFNLDSIRVPSKYPNKKHFKGPKKGQLSGNPLGKNPSDFWQFLQTELESGVFNIPNVKHNHPEKLDHPCQYPIELAERCVLAFSKEDDWVLDPFGGVGSTLLASIKNDRRGISIDRDVEYTNITQKRVSDFFAGNLKCREIGTPIYSQK
jgi:adenine-specific DNA-methyltransferase